MNIFFAAPRVHPNQVPVIEGFIKKGHNVFYLVQRKGEYEKHGDACVVTLKELSICMFFTKIIRKIRGNDYAERKGIYYFIPSIFELIRIFKKNRPDVIVVRDRTLFSLMILRIGKKYTNKIILYNQTAEYEEIGTTYINPTLKKTVSSFFPKKRMTVVEYKNYPSLNKEYKKDDNATFIPFVVRNINKRKDEYCKDNIVHIFDSGKYRNYKNHFFVVDLAKKLKNDGYTNFIITIQGQVTNVEEQDYFGQLTKYIIDNNVSDKIRLLKGVPYEDMEQLFLDNDIFVLASKSEVANVSILDAMMYSLLTISTSANGTASYIVPGVTGHVYESNNIESLCSVIEYYLDNIGEIEKIGKNAHEYVKDKFSFNNYYKQFMELINKD